MARPGLTGHRKFRRLARTIGSAIVARGALELMWELAYESGEDYLGTSDDIETGIGWTGERGVMTRALAEAGAPEGYGFIEPIDPTSDSTGRPEPRFRIHDLWHHAPEYVKKRRERELERQQKQAPLDKRRRSADNNGHSAPTSDRLPGLDRTPSPSPAPSPSPVAKNGSPEPRGGSGQATTSPTVMEFQIVGAGGSVWTLTEAQVAAYEQDYPNLDVRLSARWARRWLDENPGRRKTSKGMGRFLSGWFGRAVNRGECLRDGRRPDTGRQTRPGGYAPRRSPWSCPHVEQCGAPSICANAVLLKRPEKPGAVYDLDEHGIPRAVEAS